MNQYFPVLNLLIFNAPSLWLSSIYVTFYLLGNGVQVFKDKYHPNTGKNISIHHLLQTLHWYNNIYYIQKVGYKWYQLPFNIPQFHERCGKIVKHNVILGIDITISKVLDASY